MIRQGELQLQSQVLFNEDPYQYVVNPNDYLNFDNIGSDDPLRDTRINATNEHNLSKSNSLSANATLQLNRKLNNEGRNIYIPWFIWIWR
mgnify:CR=1 FL=1